MSTDLEETSSDHDSRLAHNRHEAPHATPTPLPNLVDIDTLAAHLGVSVRHVRRLVAERRIPFVKWGHLLRFDPIAIATWLDDQRVDPAPPRVRVVPHR